MLTPHDVELSRIIKEDHIKIKEDRKSYAIATAKRFGCVVGLKGYKTVVTDGQRVFVNPTGNPGMATGGSGDVLTGIIIALIAQGFKPYESTCLGVYLHGLAGDLAAKKFGEISLIATDILDFTPEAFRSYKKLKVS
jgi:NAD(P)H-hydrate epimerase